MGFFGIGFWEILLILIVVLIVLGPHRLPEFARTMGKMVRTLRKASSDITTAITGELDLEEKNQASPSTKEGDKVATGEAPSSLNQASTSNQDDQPTKPGGTSAVK